MAYAVETSSAGCSTNTSSPHSPPSRSSARLEASYTRETSAIRTLRAAAGSQAGHCAPTWPRLLESPVRISVFGTNKVYPLATLARSRRAATEARVLERAGDGRWVLIEAALFEDDGDGKIAVTLRTAGPADTFDLLSRAYALTQRERDIVRAVLAGLDTRAVSERLFISRHTVQDHLKSVFDKTGVHSRRELLAAFNAWADWH